MALMRYPRFRFRPSQADALHIDLWLNGECQLLDAGSYSYALMGHPPGDLAATRSHNTVEFDRRDQMPRLGRFLYGAWLRSEYVGAIEAASGAQSFEASYVDWQGARHFRRITLSGARLEVRDRISGFRDTAVLRWRLRPGSWQVEGNSVTDGRHRLTVRASAPLARFELVPGYTSLHYLSFTEVPVLEVEIRSPGELTSEYAWTR